MRGLNISFLATKIHFTVNLDKLSRPFNRPVHPNIVQISLIQGKNLLVFNKYCSDMKGTKNITGKNA